MYLAVVYTWWYKQLQSWNDDKKVEQGSPEVIHYMNQVQLTVHTDHGYTVAVWLDAGVMFILSCASDNVAFLHEHYVCNSSSIVLWNLEDPQLLILCFVYFVLLTSRIIIVFTFPQVGRCYKSSSHATIHRKNFYTNWFVLLCLLIVAFYERVSSR